MSDAPVYEQGIVAMKKYLDSYGVSYAYCVEKSEIVQRVKDTLANPPAKKAKEEEGRVGAAIPQLLGDKLQVKSGKFATSALQAKVIALYFSAHWWYVRSRRRTKLQPAGLERPAPGRPTPLNLCHLCFCFCFCLCPALLLVLFLRASGPCRSFTPALRQLYSDQLKAQGVEVVFVSSDQDDHSFAKYFAEMPWLAVPFDNRDVKDELSSKFDISGIPALIVLNAASGKVISADGRRDVMVHKANVGTHWLSLIK